MNIKLVSDLHLDFHRDGGRGLIRSLDASGVDVLVVAGDLAEAHSPVHRMGLEMLCARFQHIVYVAGNHEYYGRTPNDVVQRRARLSSDLPRLHWLDNSAVTIDGVRFVGTTLWFPDRPNNRRYAPYLSDFSMIEDFVPWVYEQHVAAREYLSATLRSDDVLVTHHLPAEASVHPRFANSTLNRFFLGDISDILQERQPQLVVHGHTHETCDYKLGRTRVVCNPFGYPGEDHVRSFDPNLLLAVMPADLSPVPGKDGLRRVVDEHAGDIEP